MPEDHLARQSEFESQFPHFVLEELAQRLQQLQVQRLGQSAHVVVRFDRVRLLRFRPGRFDDVRVDRSLRQPLHVGELRRFALEDVDEDPADDLALLLRIGNARQRRQEFMARIDVDHFHAEVLRECMHHLLGLVQAQEAMVDEYAGEAIADRPMNERGGDRRIHAAGEPQQDVLAVRLRPHRRDRLACVIAHVPVVATAADLMRETRENRLPLLGVSDLRVELDRVEPARLVGHCGEGARIRRPDQFESGRQYRDLVAVAHPHIEETVSVGVGVVLDVAEECGVTVRAHLRVPELAHLAGLDHPTQLRRHRLHAVTDAQYRHPRGPHGGRGPRRVAFGHAVRAARQDDASRRKFANERVVHVERVDLAIDVQLAQPARDELRVLRAKVENQDFRMRRSGHRYAG